MQARCPGRTSTLETNSIPGLLFAYACVHTFEAIVFPAYYLHMHVCVPSKEINETTQPLVSGQIHIYRERER